MTKRKTKRTVATLMKTATKAAEQLQGQGATWIRADIKDDRSGVVLTTVIGGEERAYIVFNGKQLDELIRLLESSRQDLS